MRWKVEISPGRTGMLNDTTQEVYSQALYRNSKFEIPVVSDVLIKFRESIIIERNIMCDNWPPVEKRRIQEGIAELPARQ